MSIFLVANRVNLVEEQLFQRDFEDFGPDGANVDIQCGAGRVCK